MLPEVRGGFKVSFFYKCHRQLGIMNDNTSHASISAMNIENSVYKSYRQRKILHEHTLHAFKMHSELKVSSTKVTGHHVLQSY